MKKYNVFTVTNFDELDALQSVLSHRYIFVSPTCAPDDLPWIEETIDDTNRVLFANNLTEGELNMEKDSLFDKYFEDREEFLFEQYWFEKHFAQPETSDDDHNSGSK